LLGEIPFDNAVGMARAIREHPKLGPCMSHKVMIYALGRGFAPEEECLVEAIVEQAAEGDYTPAGLVEAIVSSPFFLFRGIEQAGAEGGQQ